MWFVWVSLLLGLRAEQGMKENGIEMEAGRKTANTLSYSPSLGSSLDPLSATGFLPKEETALKLGFYPRDWMLMPRHWLALLLVGQSGGSMHNLPLAWSLSRPRVPPLDAWLWIPPSPNTPLTSCPSPPNSSSLLGLHFFLACTLVLRSFSVQPCLFLAPPSPRPLRSWHIKPPLSCSHLFPDVASGTSLPHSFSASLALAQLDTIHLLRDRGPVTSAGLGLLSCRKGGDPFWSAGLSLAIVFTVMRAQYVRNYQEAGLPWGRICTDTAPLWGVMLHLQEVALLCCMKHSPAPRRGWELLSASWPLRCGGSQAPGCH